MKDERENKRLVQAIVKVWQLGFVHFISKVLVESIILKERELYESKHVAVERRCLKIWDLLSFLTCYWILVLKWGQVSPMLPNKKKFIS